MIRFPELALEAEIVHAHHERYDGAGYPRALSRHDIPLGARIFAVADTYDAITSDRPYRAGRSAEAAREEIVRQSGAQFDPAIVDEFQRVPLHALNDIRGRHPDSGLCD
jgi:HD-GYP domain-containing protein (c-di-GMP phosphodiesterase class II)